MNQHEFTGSLLVCTTCYKRREHEIHTIMPRGVHTVVTSVDGPEDSQIVPTLDIYNAPGFTDVSNFTVLQPATDDDPPEMPADYLTDTGAVTPDWTNLNGVEPPVEVISVRHDPTCKCVDCLSQTVAEVRRPAHILGEKGRYLTGLESVQAALSHSQFVVLNLIKDENGVDFPNWHERVQAHRDDLRRKIELFRVQDSATLRVMAEKDTADMKEMAERLTPEELAAYKANASKPKRAARAAGAPKELDPAKELKDLRKKRDAAADAFKGMGIPTEAINAQLAPVDAKIAALEAKLAAPPKTAREQVVAMSTERLSKRERAIESLRKAGLSQEAAEKMVPNA